MPHGVRVRLPLGAQNGPVAKWKTRRAQDALPAGMRVQLPPGLLTGAFRDAGGTGRRGRLKPGWFNHARSTRARPTRGPIVSIGQDGALQKRCSWFESRSARHDASAAQWMSSGLLSRPLQVRSLSDAQFGLALVAQSDKSTTLRRWKSAVRARPSAHPVAGRRGSRPAVLSRLEQRRLSVRRARLLNGMRIIRAQVQFLSAPPDRFHNRWVRRPPQCP